MDIKKHVAGNVTFVHYRNGMLWYKTSTGIEFPVPIRDTDDALFPAEAKGITFMRWIRPHLAYLEQSAAARLAQVNGI